MQLASEAAATTLPRLVNVIPVRHSPPFFATRFRVFFPSYYPLLNYTPTSQPRTFVETCPRAIRSGIARYSNFRCAEASDRHSFQLGRAQTLALWRQITQRTHSELTGTLLRRATVATNDFFWMTGKPGSGKSTLIRFIAEHHQTRAMLQQWRGGSQLMIATFFFRNAGNKMQTSLLGLMQGLLHQIVLQTVDANFDVVASQRETGHESA